jgi:hypothetical protein
MDTARKVLVFAVTVLGCISSICSIPQASCQVNTQSGETLARIVAWASQKQLSTLRGTKDPDIDDTWDATLDPGLGLNCSVSYDTDDHSYSYLCSKRYDNMELAAQEAQRVEDIVNLSVRDQRFRVEELGLEAPSHLLAEQRHDFYCCQSTGSAGRSSTMGRAMLHRRAKQMMWFSPI